MLGAGPGGGQDSLPKETSEQKAGEPEPVGEWRVLQAECTAGPKALRQKHRHQVRGPAGRLECWASEGGRWGQRRLRRWGPACALCMRWKAREEF